MKQEEEIARNYLNQLGIGNPCFEPDGNIPPDFSLNDKIGIEVRRLNQNFKSEKRFEGLEEKRIPLKQIVREVLSEFDSHYSGETFYVAIKYKRPFNRSFKEFKSLFRNKLHSFLKNSPPTPHEIKINSEFSIKIVKASPRTGIVFMFAIDFDRDRGGWLIGLFNSNVSLCINDKNEKIKPFIHNYDNWWLLLVDFIGLHGLKEDYQSILPDKKNFDKVLIVNPITNSLIIEF